MLLAVEDWRNALAVAVEIIAGFAGLSLLILSIGGACWLISKTGWRL
jgi:hypothetical protein